MSLTTTMGVELTYVPAAIQTALDRGADFDPEHAPDGSLVNAFSTLLKYIVRAKKIPVMQVSTDPGCVEVPTRPYSKLSQLLSVARRLGREAEALGLVTNAEYTNGGGAHIHTGVIGADSTERDMYRARMMLFCALNPWFAWATLNVNDDINAKPICRHMLTRRKVPDDSYTVACLEERIRDYRAAIIQMQDRMHHLDTWSDDYMRPRAVREFGCYRESYIGYRMQLAKLTRQIKAQESEKSALIPVRDISLQGHKDHMVRFTNYGIHGTVEFRCFEMGNEAKLKRNILLANAICRYVERWKIEEYNPKDVMSGNVMRKIKWSEAKAGWLAMLATLGMDARDYRNETAQIAARWRWSRMNKQDPTAADATERRPTGGRTAPTNALVLVEARRRERLIARCRGRRDRRDGRRAAFQAAHAGA